MIKIFTYKTPEVLEREVNKFLNNLDYRIHSVEYGYSEGTHSCLIWYGCLG